MVEFMSFAAIPAIVTITYFTCEVYKWIISDAEGNPKNKKAFAFIPILSGAVGLILGLAIYFFTPELIQADNWFTASAIGITSGFSAVGIHQVGKQINKLKDK